MAMLDDKLKQAGGVVARMHAKIVARADKLIAREADIEHKTDAAFGVHEAMLDSQEQGLDDLEKRLAIVTNGGPPLPDTGSGEHSVHQLPTDSDNKVLG